MNDGTFGERFAKAGIPVHTLDMPNGRLTIKGIFKLYRLIRSIRPDVVQTWMYHSDLLGGLIAKLARVGGIVWGVRHSNLNIHTTPFLTRFVMKCCALSSSQIPNRIVFNSMKSLQVHVQKGYVLNKAVLIHNGCDIVKFSPDQSNRDMLRRSWGIDRNNILLGMIARWHPDKDYANLITALGIVKRSTSINWKAIFVGQGITNDNRDLTAMLELNGLTGRVLKWSLSVGQYLKELKGIVVVVGNTCT